jgi:cysteine-rich repeat protein
MGQTVILTMETTDGFLGTTCVSNSLDSKFNLRAANGALIATDDDSGEGYCSLLVSSNLTPGDYYLEVSDPVLNGQPGFEYVLKITKQIFVCGDGVKDPLEQCDDGNMNLGDGCDLNCKIEPLPETEPNSVCGSEDGPFNAPVLISGLIKPVADHDYFAFVVPAVADLKIETFDMNGPGTCTGMDTIVQLRAPDCTTILTSDDDAGVGSCSLIDSQNPLNVGARKVPPGTYIARVEEYGNNAEIQGYTVYITFNALCGDGVKQGSEECDAVMLPTATCDASCERIPTCGDGFVDSPPEQCEDGNQISGDGCSDMCLVEGAVPEVEPNGTFAEADASAVQLTGDTFVTGSISPLADKDTFKLVLAQDSTVRFETFDGGFVDCAAGVATTLKVYNSALAQLYTDSGAGISTCSALVINLVAGTYYVQVEENGNNALIANYTLEVDVQTPAGPEVEPNETQATSTDQTAQTTDFYIAGDHQLGTDTDYYAITVPAGASLRVEAAEGAAETCESNEVDTFLTLYNAAGTEIDFDDDSGRGFCSLMDGTGASPLDPKVHALPGGTYYLKVKTHINSEDDSKGMFNYRIAVTVRSP